MPSSDISHLSGSQLKNKHGWQVTAPARLHFGFINLDPQALRRFGGFGIALAAPMCRVKWLPDEELIISGDEEGKLHDLITYFDRLYGVESNGRIELVERIPRHAGLGSGTQLVLAVVHLLGRVHGLRLESREVAVKFRRGLRSGIGVAAFEHGNFIVDGGKKDEARVPPLLANLEFPAEWRIVLVLDHEAKGLHGSDEHVAFGKLKKLSLPCAKDLGWLVLAEILPALVECDYAGFSNAFGRFQHMMGDSFASFQGGRHYSSPGVAKVLEYLSKQGIKGIGQSSWGPSAYAIARNPSHAEEIKRLIKHVVETDPAIANASIGILDTTVNPVGARIEKIIIK